jgi:hypothetical protein
MLYGIPYTFPSTVTASSVPLTVNDLKDKDVKLAYLQTEEGFIPEKIYSSIGFEKVCTAFIAVEDTENYNMR